jgi:hypothetical protein
MTIIGASRVVIKIGVAIGKNAVVGLHVVVTKCVPTKNSFLMEILEYLYISLKSIIKRNRLEQVFRYSRS